MSVSEARRQNEADEIEAEAMVAKYGMPDHVLSCGTHGYPAERVGTEKER